MFEQLSLLYTYRLSEFFLWFLFVLFLIRLDLEMHFSSSRVLHVTNNVVINLGVSKRSYDNGRTPSDFCIELESCITFLNLLHFTYVE